MRPFWARVASFWCRQMHGEPMWPMHGRYECRICGRRHRVCWEDGPVAQGYASAPQRAAQGLVRGGIVDARRSDDFGGAVAARVDGS